MVELLIFIVAVALSVELAGACVAVFDSRGQLDQRAKAVERVALPLLLWCALWWLSGPDAARVMLSALTFVIAWQFIAYYAVALLSRWPRFFTSSIDTDGHRVPEPAEKKIPGDSGDWGGEGKSPGR